MHHEYQADWSQCINWFIHLFNKYLRNTYYELGIVVCAGNIMVIKINTTPALKEVSLVKEPD